MIFLAIVDILISSFIILPLVISFWRGTWEYLYYSQKFPIVPSFIVGIVLHIFFTILRGPLYQNKRPGLIGLIIARIYIYIFSIISIMQWRGYFALIDQYLAPKVIYISFSTCLLVLIGIKGVGSLVGLPFIVPMDHRQKDVFIYPTMFQRDSAENVWMYILDCAFSVCVIGTLVVFVWRGTWSLLDTYLYPENFVISTWLSLGIGYGIVGLTFLLQPPIKYLAKELSGIPRLLIVDLYLLFSFCGTVNVWRGIWNLLNIYFFPKNPLLSYSLSHIVPFLLLVLINSSNSILVRGVYIDGEEAGSQCVDFPCYYLRLFFQSKRKKKLLREAAKRQSGRRSEGEVIVQISGMPIEGEWKKSANNTSPEASQLLKSP